MIPITGFGQTDHWRLIWDKNTEPDMSYYLIYRDTAINPTTEIGRTDHPDTVYVDYNIQPGILYYYRVTAVDSSELSSDYSDNVSSAIPLTSDIPDQTVAKGETFSTFDLDDYVDDPDNADSELEWTYSGNTELTVSIDANHVATIGIPNSNWYGSETITFTAMDPDSFFNLDSATFTVENNEAPAVSDIPDQTVNQGEEFAQISLDDYVNDPDNTDSEMTWTYSGNNQLNVTIDANRVATISKPSSDWTGSETITFTATDPGGLSDSDPAVFKVNAPPQVTDIPDQTVNQGGNFVQIHLDEYVSDPDNADDEMTWTYSGNSALTVTIENRIATIAIPSSDWYGSESITFTATDPGGLFDSDAATFKVNAPPVVDHIPGQAINQGTEFATFDLDSLVADPDNTDAELTWVYSGNNELTVSINADHLVTITKPSADWYGTETITFTATDPGGLSDSGSGDFFCNAAPVVSDIPDQLLNQGQSFTEIHLDEYVNDPDNGDAELNWTYSGNSELIVSIDVHRVATISTPTPDWSGSEEITFTATDPRGLSDSNPAVFSINAAPVVSDIPDQVLDQGQSFATIPLDDYVTDTDNADAEQSWSYSGNNELTVSIDANRVATVTAPAGWAGKETITFTATDPGGLNDSDPAEFTVLSSPVVSDIPDQLFNEGETFTQIALDNYVTDLDNRDDEQTWTYSGNSELIVSIDANRVATIMPPAADWAGSETIRFTATDPDGLHDSDAATFTMNAAPEVSDIPDQTIYDTETFATFNLDDYVHDPDNPDESLTWTYSGNTLLSVAIDQNHKVTIEYPAGWTGTETISFTATDPGGLTDSDPASFTVLPNNAPVVSDIPDQSIPVGGQFAAIVLDDYVSDPDNSKSEINWSHSGETSLVVSIDANRIATITAPAGWSGTETIVFTATDPDNLSDSNAASFTVNAAPVVSSIPDQKVNQGNPFTTINLDDYVTDANNDKSELTWDFSGNSELSVSINANHEATIITPDDSWFGSETITFRATDPGGLWDTTRSVFKVNAAPVVANIPNQYINEGESFHQIALDDYVSDGDNSDAEITWQASGNQVLSVSISPQHMATISYPPDWHSSETITFTATDPDGLSNSDPAVFSLNAAPVVSTIPDQESAEGEAFAPIDLNTYVSDADNTDSELSWSFFGNSELQISINANHVVHVIKPDLYWAGSETITFVVEDPNHLKDSTSAVFHTNARPQMASIPDQTINQGQQFTTIALDNYVTDADDAKNALVWKAEGQTQLTVIIDTSRVAHILTPNADWHGSETIRFTVKDSHNTADSTEVVFKVNAAPQIASIPDQIIPKVHHFTDIRLDAYLNDPDNSPAEMVWGYAGNQHLNMQIDAGHVLHIEAPYANWLGADTVMLSATDPMGLSAVDTVVFAKYSTNRPPVITSQPVTEAEAKQVYAYQLTVSDPDSGDTQSFAFITAPPFLSVSDSGLISGTPAIADTGAYDVSVLVRDMEAAADTQSYRLRVHFNPSAPVIATIPGQTILEGSEFLPLYLNTYVRQQDSEDSLRWSYSGNRQLRVFLDTANVAFVTIPDSNWYGNENITFRVTNRYGQFAEQAASFTVTGVNDSPQLLPIPAQTIFQNDLFDPIFLDDYVSDVDNGDQTLHWVVPDSRHLTVEINAARQAQVTPRSADWIGSDTLFFTVSDPGGLSAQRTVRFTIKASIFKNMVTQFKGSGTVVEVRWQSTIAVKGHLLYGLDEPDMQTESEEAFTTQHRMVISGLDENSDYVLRATGTDSVGATYQSQLFHVQTKAAGEINVFPNPYRAGRYPEDDVIHFANLPEGGSVSVYNFLGEPVYQKKGISSFFTWKAVNNSGRQIQAGLYIWVIKDAQNKKVKSGKIVIIR